MFAFFERFLTPTAAPENPEPPGGLIAFLWHFARQAKWLFVALFVIELFVALSDSAVPWFMGRVVTMVTKTPPDQLLTLRPIVFMIGHHFLISAVWYAASPAGFC